MHLDATFPEKIVQGQMSAMPEPELIAVFSGAKSPVRIYSEKPIFCAVGADHVQIVALDTHGNERRTAVGKASTQNGANGVHPQWFNPFYLVPTRAVESFVHGEIFESERPFFNQEYAIFVDTPDQFPSGRSVDPHLVKVYDFGYYFR
jgi:hypothetical protein